MENSQGAVVDRGDERLEAATLGEIGPSRLRTLCPAEILLRTVLRHDRTAEWGAHQRIHAVGGTLMILDFRCGAVQHCILSALTYYNVPPLRRPQYVVRHLGVIVSCTKLPPIQPNKA